MRIKALVSLAMAAELLLFNQFAFAHTIATGTHNNNFTPHSTPVTSAQFANAVGVVNLDLGSTKATISAGNMALANALNINVGGHLSAVNAQSMLTAAEFLAAVQVATSGVQTLKLSSSGNAVGGRFSIPSVLSQDVGNLVIPQGVKELDNAALTPTLSLSGDLTDAGSFVAFTTNPHAASAQVSAANIYVQAGGLLTSLGSHGSTPVDLALSAVNSLNNAGVISSSGNLSLYSGSGNFTNSGMISTAAGNINVGAAPTSNITFNGTGGTVQAPNGAISFRDASYTGVGNLTLNGGNYLSQTLNLYSGTGAVNMNVGQVTGVVNTYAGSANFKATTPVYHVGVMDVSGDPTIIMTGDIDLGTDATPSDGYLVALATQNIFESQTGQSIDTTSDGGNVVLAAGVNADSTNPNAIVLSSSGSGGDVWLDAGCPNCSGGPSQPIQGFSTAGGNVTLIALANTAGTSGGHVVLPSGIQIDTSNGTTSGTVTVIAEAALGNGGDAVSIPGGIYAGSSGGVITVASATPSFTPTIDGANGNVSGNFYTGSTAHNGTLTPGTMTAGGTLTINTLGTLNLTSGAGSSAATSATISASAINMSGGTSVGTLSGDLLLTSTAGLTITGDDFGTEAFSAAGGQLSFNVSGGTLEFTSQTGFGSTWQLTSSSVVNFTSDTAVLLDSYVALEQPSGSAPYTLTAPTLQMNYGAFFGEGGNNSFTIHTNNVVTASGNTLNGKSLTIDDNFSGSTGGITFTGSGQISIGSINGVLSVSAQEGSGDLIFQSALLTSATINFDSGSSTAISFSATGSFQVGSNTTVGNTNSTSNYSITAPTVSLADGAVIDTTDGNHQYGYPGTDLNIHTNQLNLGDGSNGSGGPGARITGNNVTVDDSFTGSTNTLNVAAFATIFVGQSISAFSGTVAINANHGASDSLVLTSSTPGTEGILYFDAPTAVNLTATGSVKFDTNMAVANNSSNSTWTVEAPTVTLADGASLTPSDNGAQLNIHTNNLNLGDGSSSGASVSITGNGVSVSDTNMTASGVTVTGYNLASEYINGVSGDVEFSSGSGNLTFNSSTPGTGTTITLDSSSEVSLVAAGNASQSITFGLGVTVNNSSSSGLWLLQANTVNVDDAAPNATTLDTTPGGAFLDIQTHNLNLGSAAMITNGVASIAGIGVTVIDSANAPGAAGLTVTAYTGDNESINAGSGTLTLLGFQNGADLKITSSTVNSFQELVLDGAGGVQLTAPHSVIVDQGMFLLNSVSSGTWQFTAPTVTFSDGAIVYTDGPPAADIQIHTNQLNFGDGTNGGGVTIEAGGNLTIDDSAAPNPGVTITEPAGASNFMKADGGQLTINTGQTSTTLSINSTGTSFTSLSLDGSTGVSFSATSLISVAPGMFLTKGSSAGSWQWSAPTVNLADNVFVDLHNVTAPVSLTISTNNLNLGNGSGSAGVTIEANGITINDSGMPLTGLGVASWMGETQHLRAFVGSLSISSATNLVGIESSMASVGATFELDGDAGVSISAANAIEIGKNTIVENFNSTGSWSLTAPTVELSDGAALNSDNSGSAASLTIHANYLELGDGTGSPTSTSLTGAGVTIDDGGTLSSGGLTITGWNSTQEQINATSGALNINAANGISPTLLFTSSTSGTGSEIDLDGASVNISSTFKVTFDTNMSVENTTLSTGGSWSVTAPTITMNDGVTLRTANGSAAVSLAIHTNNLNLGSTTSGDVCICGNGVTIDDNGGSVFTSTGLTITLLNSAIENVQSFEFTTGDGKGTLAISPTGALLITETAGSDSPPTRLWLDGADSTTLSSGSSVTIDQNVTVQNSFAVGSWTVTAPTVTLNDGAILDTTNASGGPATLAIHTNNLNLGSAGLGNVTILGNGITIDDTGMTAHGLTVTTNTIANNFVNSLIASSTSGSDMGTLSISSSTSSVFFTQPISTTSLVRLTLDGEAGVSVSAGTQITIDSYMFMGTGFGFNSGNWTLTAPTVTLNDGADLHPRGDTVPVSLTIHTNNLVIGNGILGFAPLIVGNGITIDDTGMSTPGLTISVFNSQGGQIDAVALAPSAGVLAINSSTTLLITSTTPGTGASLNLDGDGGVSLTAHDQITFDANMFVNNHYSSGNWTLTSPTVFLKDGAVVSSTFGTDPAMLTVDTNNLKLGSTAAGGAYLDGNGITIDDNGGSVFSTTGLSITLSAGSTETIGNTFVPNSVNSGQLLIEPQGALTITSGVSGPSAQSTLNLETALGVEMSTPNASGITFALYTTTQNFASAPSNWTLTAPSVSLENGTSLNTTNDGGSTLFINTNTLAFSGGDPSANSASITAANISIDDDGGSVFSTTGLSIQSVWVRTNVINAGTGFLSIFANRAISSSLSFSVFPNASLPGTLVLDGGSVTLRANNQITFGANLTVENQSSSAGWGLTAPTVAVNDGGSVNVLANGAGLIIHTNNLNLGDGTNTGSATIASNNVDVTDSGMTPGSGLTVTAEDTAETEFISSSGNNIVQIQAQMPSAGVDVLTFAGAGGKLALDSPVEVSLSSPSKIVFNASTTVGNSSSTVTWYLSAPTVQMNDGSTLTTAGVLGSGGSGAQLYFNTTNLNLGDNSNNTSVHVAGTDVFVSDFSVGSPGVEIRAESSTVPEYITATTGVVNVTASITGADQVTFGSFGGTLVMDGADGVNVTASNKILFHNSVTVGNSTSTGDWTLTAPTVQMNDGSTLDTSGALGTGGNGANLTIHTNNLNLGDNSNHFSVDVKGNVVTLDDAVGVGGLTITGADGTDEFVTAATGDLTINATTGGNLTLSGNDPTLDALLFDSPTSVKINAGNLITFTANVFVGNSPSAGAWTVTAPQITFDDIAELGISGTGAGSLTIHTNTLTLGDVTNPNNYSVIYGNSVTIDDATFAANSGLTIKGVDGVIQRVHAVLGALTINATNGSSDNLLLSSVSGTGSTLYFNSPTNVSLTASSQITFDDNMNVKNSIASGAWVVQAPTVQLNDGATVDTTPGGADITIHTNNLTLGDNSNMMAATVVGNNVTIDDVGMAAGSGVKITASDTTVDESISASAALSISATNTTHSVTSDSLTFAGSSGVTILLDAATSVGMTASTQILEQAGVTVANTTSTGAWTLSAPTVQLNDNTDLNSIGHLGSGGPGADMTIHTNNLNLGDNSSGTSLVFVAGNNLTIDDTGMPVSGLTITSANGNSYFAELTAETGTLTINATKGTSDTLSIASRTLGQASNLYWNGANSVNVSASQMIQFGQLVSVQSNTSNSVWTLAAPTVSLSDGAYVLNANGGSASVTVHTNSLNLGDNTNEGGVLLGGSSLSVDDTTMAVGGLTITVANSASTEYSLQAVVGQLSISAGNGTANLLFTQQTPGTFVQLFMDGTTGVSLSASGTLRTSAGLFVSGGSAPGNWTMTASSVSIGDTGALSVNNSSTLSITTGSLNLGNSAQLSAGGAMGINGDGFDPLVVNMGAGSLLASSASVNFNPNSVSNILITSGNGRISGTTSVNFNLGAGAGSVLVNAGEIDGTVNARGFSISVTSNSGNDLTVGLITVPNAGGPITLANTIGNVSLTMPLTSNGGAINVNATSVINGNQNINASGSTSSGGAITLTAAFLEVGTVTSNGASTGSGGTIQITTNTTNSLNIGGSGFNNQTGAISALGGSTSGDGGQVTVTNLGNGGVTLNTAITANPLTEGAGGSVIVNSANGPLTINSGNTISVDAAGIGNHIGGTISITAKTITAGGTGLTLNANGVNSGAGGSVTVDVTDATGDVSVGDPTVGGNFAINANGGTSGSAGTVILEAGRNVTVNPAFLSATAGTGGGGATYEFTAGNNLLVTSGISANANGGAGGSITLISNGSSPFMIVNGSTTNGVEGGVFATGGTAGTGGILVQANSDITIGVTANVDTSGNLKFTTSGAFSNSGNVMATGTLNVDPSSFSNTSSLFESATSIAIQVVNGTFSNTGTIKYTGAATGIPTIFINGGLVPASTMTMQGGPGTLDPGNMNSVSISQPTSILLDSTFSQNIGTGSESGVQVDITTPLLEGNSGTPTFTAVSSTTTFNLTSSTNTLEFGTVSGTPTITFANADVVASAVNLQVDSGVTLKSSNNALSLTGLGGGNITLSGNLNGATVAIDATGAGTISGAGTVTGTTSVTLGHAGDSGLITLSGLATANVTFNTNGAATLTDSVALTGNGASTGAVVSLTDSAAGGMTLTGSIAGTTVALNASGGQLSGAATITGNTSVTLGNAGDGGLINLPGLATQNVTFNTSGAVTLVDSVALTGNGASTGSVISLTDSAVGGITLTGSITGTTVTMNASGGQLSGAGTITGNTSVTLGNAGDSGLINMSGLATANVTFNTSGAVTLVDSVAMTGNGASTGGAVSLTDSAAGGMTLTGSITGTTVTLNASGGQLSGAATIAGNTSVTLGHVGDAGLINLSGLATPNATFTTSGDVTLVDSVALTGNGASTGGAVSLTDSASGGMTLTGSISGTTVTLNASAGQLSGAGTITGNTSVTLGNAGDTGLINMSGLATPNVTFTTSGDVTLVDSVALTGNGASTGGAVSLTDSAADGMTLTGSISGTTVTLNAPGGQLSGAGTITGNTSVTLGHAGDAGLINLSGLATPNVTFITSGDVTLVDSVAMTGNGASTGGAVSLTDSAAGGMTLTGSINGTTVTLNASGGQLSGAATITGNTSVTLGHAGDAGLIDLTGLATANVTFNTTGDVTLVDSVAMTGNGASTGGAINLTDSAAGGMTLTGSITGTTVTLNAPGGQLSGAGTITGNTSVTLGNAGDAGLINLTGLATPSMTFTTSGDVTLVDSVAMTGNGASTGSAVSVKDTAAGGMTLTGSINGTTIALDATSGAISGAGTITGATSVTLGDANATGAINLTNLATKNVTFTTSGDVTLIDSVALTGSGTSTGNAVSLTESAAGGMNLTGSMTGTTVVLNATGGGVISAAALATPNVTFTTTGDVTLTDTVALTGNGVSTGGNVSLTDASSIVTTNNMTATGTLAVTAGTALTMGTGTTFAAGGNMTLGSTGNMTLANLTSFAGAIDATAALNAPSNTGTLTEMNGAQVVTVTGNITLQNNNTATGSMIKIGQNVTISAGGAASGQGNVNIIFGGATTVAGKAPKNVKITKVGTGAVLFGTNSITANAPTNNIFVTNKQVNFNTTTALPATSIVLEGGDTISASSASALTSLDLTDPLIAGEIKTAQNNKLIGGSLILSGPIGTGIAIGGTVTLKPLNLLPTITGENIPQGVTATLTGFQNINPIDVSLTGTNQVQINGTEKFTTSNAVENVTSTGTGTLFTLGATGLLTDDSTFMLNVAGSAVLNGKASAKTTFTLNTTANGDINIGGTIGTSSSAFVLNAGGAGDIVQTSGTASLVGKTVTLMTNSGDVGSAIALVTKATTLVLNTTTGDVNLNNVGAMVLGATSNVGGTLSLADTGKLTLNSVTSTDDMTLLATTAIVVNANANISATDGVVTIAIGAAGTVPARLSPTPPLPNPPANVTVTLGSTVFFGANSIVGKTPANTITTTGTGVVVFSTGSLKASAITLGGGVHVTSNISFNSQDSSTSEQVVDTGDDGQDEDSSDSFMPIEARSQ